MLDYVCHCIGSAGSSAVYPRDVLKSCLYKNARAVILCHNHPGGKAEPSLNDKEITRQLIFALKMIDVEVLDHVIICKDSFYSFADSGLIDDMKSKFKENAYILGG